MKKALGIFLILCIVLSLLPCIASAEQTVDYGLYFTDNKIYAYTYNASGLLQQGGEVTIPGLSFEDGVYIFDNVTFTTTIDSAIRVYSPQQPVNFVLCGVNEVTAGSSSGNLAAAVNCDADLVISGEADSSLTLKAGSANYARGIYCYNLTVNSGTLIAEAGEGTANSSGIECSNMTVNGGTVCGTGGEAGKEHSRGISASSFNLHEGTVTATGGSTAGDTGRSYGLYCVRNFLIDGGTLTATGGSCKKNNYGIYVIKTATVSGGTVNATGGTTDGRSTGFGADDDFIMSGGTVNAFGGTAGEMSVGLFPTDNLNITGGGLRAAGTQASVCRAIYLLNGKATVAASLEVRQGADAAAAAAAELIPHEDSTDLRGTLTAPYAIIAKKCEHPNTETRNSAEATCTEAGYTGDIYCTECDALVEKGEAIPALGHDMIADAAVPATCTEPGLTAGEHCSRCDYAVAQETVEALGHDMIVDAAVPATCTKPGLTAGEHCSRCDYAVAQETVEALGHSFVDGVCTRCGEKDPDYIPPDPCEGYTDINRSAWYHTAADFVISRGLMGSTKTDALTFEPNTKVSRAMVASILYRMANSPAASYKATFTDVPNGKWFTAAIEWCAQNGLASGKGNGKFDPNGNVTRQELAVFMKKMAEYLEKPTDSRDDLTSFADASKVPSWAKDYVAWAVSAGLISGKASNGKTYLAPTDNATRAEFASIIMRFVRNIAES